jgi:hypothetical protein
MIKPASKILSEVKTVKHRLKYIKKTLKKKIADYEPLDFKTTYKEFIQSVRDGELRIVKEIPGNCKASWCLDFLIKDFLTRQAYFALGEKYIRQRLMNRLGISNPNDIKFLEILDYIMERLEKSDLEKIKKFKEKCRFKTFLGLAATHLLLDFWRKKYRKDWEKYLQLETVPRDNFYIYVYKKMNGAEPFIPTAKAQTPRIPGGIRLGEDFSLIEKKWGKTYTRGFRIGVEEEAVRDGWAIDLKVIVKEGVRVVAIEKIIEIVEQEFTPGESILTIISRYGMPQKKVHHTGGHFYVYQDRGVSVKEIGGQVCSYIWYEKGF